MSLLLQHAAKVESSTLHSPALRTRQDVLHYMVKECVILQEATFRNSSFHTDSQLRGPQQQEHSANWGGANVIQSNIY